MPPRNAPVMTRFSTSAPLASSTASPLLLAPVELVMRGCDARLVDPATGGPPGTSGAPSATTAGPSPISRCPGLSAMPPSSGGTESGDASTTIVSPGPDAAWTTARLLNGALALPSPPPAARALTYQRRWAPRPLPSLSVRSAIAAPATMSVATLPSSAALTIERTRGVITAFPLDVLCADVLRAAGRGQRRSPRPRRHRAVAGERSLAGRYGTGALGRGPARREKGPGPRQRLSRHAARRATSWFPPCGLWRDRQRRSPDNFRSASSAVLVWAHTGNRQFRAGANERPIHYSCRTETKKISVERRVLAPVDALSGCAGRRYLRRPLAATERKERKPGDTFSPRHAKAISSERCLERSAISL